MELIFVDGNFAFRFLDQSGYKMLHVFMLHQKLMLGIFLLFLVFLVFLVS